MDSGQAYRGRAMKATGSNILFGSEVVPLIQARHAGGYPLGGGFTVSITKVRETTLKDYKDFCRADDNRSTATDVLLMDGILSKDIK